jgi:hypothetical protein
MEMASLCRIAPPEVRKLSSRQQDVRATERETLNFSYSVVRAVYKVQASSQVEFIATWSVQGYVPPAQSSDRFLNILTSLTL